MKIGQLRDERCSRLVFWAAWVAYACTYIGRINYSAALAGMVSAQLFTKAEASVIGTVFFFCYGAGQLVNGFLGDRLSPFPMLFTGLTVSACMNALMCWMPSALWLSVVWGLNGLAQSMIWSPIVRILSTVLAPSQQRKACLNIASTTPVGTVAAYALSMLMLRFFSWRAVFLAAGLCMLPAVGLWIYAWRRYAGQETVPPASPAPLRPSAGGGKGLWPLLLASGAALLVLPTLLHGMLKDVITTWVPTMITESYGVSPSFSLGLTLVLPIVNLSGAVGATWLCHRHCGGNEVKAAAWCMVAILPLLGCLCFIGRAPIYLAVLLLALCTSLLLGFNHMLITLLPVRFGPYGKTSTVSGTLNSTIYIGCSLSNYVFGLVADRGGWTVTVFYWLLIAALTLLLCLAALRPWGRFCQERPDREQALAGK